MAGIRLNIVDDRNQLFPIGLSEGDLCNLLQIVGYMSQDMAITQQELGGEPGVNIVDRQAENEEFLSSTSLAVWMVADRPNGDARHWQRRAEVPDDRGHSQGDRSGYCGPSIAPRDWCADRVTHPPACIAIGAAEIQDDTLPPYLVGAASLVLASAHVCFTCRIQAVAQGYLARNPGVLGIFRPTRSHFFCEVRLVA